MVPGSRTDEETWDRGGPEERQRVYVVCPREDYRNVNVKETTPR